MDILILLRAGIRHKKGAFWSIAILMMIITFSVTAIISVNRNIETSLKQAIDKIDTGDVVAFISQRYATPELLGKLRAHPRVERMKELETLSAAAISINGKSSTNRTMLQRLETDHFDYRVYNDSLTGFKPSPGKLAKGEIYVPLSYVTLYDSKAGDTITVRTRAGQVTYTIKDFIQEPFLGSYFIGVKCLFLAPEDYAELEAVADSETDAEPLVTQYRMVHLFQADSSGLTVPKFKKQLNQDTAILDYSFATLSREDSMSYTQIFTNIGTGILTAFVLLLFIIVMIIMGHSISTGIEMDYTNIGVLKSQGFTKGKLRQVLTLQYLSAQLIGAVLGNLMAIPLVGWIGRLFQPINGILAVSDLAVLPSLAVTVLILLLGSLFVYLKTARVGAISPLRAISGGRESIYFDSLMNVPVDGRGLGARIAFRQFTSAKRQYVALIAITAILIYFMMSMTLLTGGLTSQSISEGYGTIYSDLTFKLNNRFTMDRRGELEAEIRKISPVTFSQYTAGYYFSVDGSEFHTTLFSNPGLLKNVSKGRAPIYDNEVIITEILAGELDKYLGDTVTVSFRGGKADYMISGYYDSMNDVGRTLAMSLEGAQRIYPVEAQDGYINLEDPGAAERVVSMLNDQYSGILKAEASTEEEMAIISTALDGVALLIYAVSVLFALVVVFMVCNRIFLKERRDIGIYKAMGFTSRRLRLQFALRFLMIAVVGSMLGICASLLFNSGMMSTLLKTMGVTKFNPTYTPFSLLFPSLLLGLCFFIFSYLASAKIKHVAARELIVE